MKAQRKGWENRMCTLQLTVFADGIQRAKPVLIFKGSPNKKEKRRVKEIRQYHTNVIVVWNAKAYSNTQEILWWIKNQYAGATEYALSKREPRLLCLDAFAPHKTQGVNIPENETEGAKAQRLAEQEGNRQIKEELAKLNTTVSIIPGGCTGYVQVLDVSINKLVKKFIEEEEQIYYDNNLDTFAAETVNIGQRRILMTWWVATAWKRVHDEYQDLIVKTFKHVGLSLNPNGSKDRELKIKDLPSIAVGD
jgi:hypothetical protein